MNLKRLRLLALTAMAMSGTASADPALTGHYRLDEGHEAAGELELKPDGTFRYALSYGALDEWSEGRWESKGGSACLITEPKPVPPEFRKLSLKPGEEPEATLLVTWPNGQGIAGVDFVIGFDAGEPQQGYTQYYGWTMPEDDTRTPRWIELFEPIYRLRSQRFELTEGDRGTLHVVIIPNDLGLVNLTGACLEESDKRVILHRQEGDMRFVRL